jgi:hypothetical protein
MRLNPGWFRKPAPVTGFCEGCDRQVTEWSKVSFLAQSGRRGAVDTRNIDNVTLLCPPCSAWVTEEIADAVTAVVRTHRETFGAGEYRVGLCPPCAAKVVDTPPPFEAGVTYMCRACGVPWRDGVPLCQHPELGGTS